MRTFLVAQATFGAGHRLDPSISKDHSAQVHGHDYTVRVFFLAGQELDVAMRSVEQAQTALDTLVRELRNRNLNDMLPAGHPSVVGLGGYLLERLLMAVDSPIWKVEVDESHGPSAILERDLPR